MDVCMHSWEAAERAEEWMHSEHMLWCSSQVTRPVRLVVALVTMPWCALPESEWVGDGQRFSSRDINNQRRLLRTAKGGGRRRSMIRSSFGHHDLRPHHRPSERIMKTDAFKRQGQAECHA